MQAEMILAQMGFPGETGWNASLANQSVLRAGIRPGLPGVYLMMANRRLLYTGRSDTCLLNRLLSHEKLALAAVILWKPCPSAYSAYLLEHEWYRRLSPGKANLNKIVPAAPFGTRAVGNGTDR